MTSAYGYHTINFICLVEPYLISNSLCETSSVTGQCQAKLVYDW